MTTPTTDREIARLAGPALITLLAEPVYLLVDTAIVGHLGSAQLSGLAVASSILLTATSLCIFLAYGTTASVARLLGAGNRQAAADDAVQGIWLGLAVGVLLTVALAAASRPLVGALGAEGAVADHALLYLRISLLGLPALLVVLAGTGYLRGMQDTRTPLMVAVGTAAINLVLDVVLIYGFGFGLGASATGTVVAQVVGAVVYLVAVLGGARAVGARLRPRLRAAGRLLRVGLDLFVRTAALRGSLLVLVAVATRIGADEVAAHQIGFEVWTFLAMGLDALAIAGQALIGRALGAGDVAAARWAGGRLLRFGLLASGATGLLVLALIPVVPPLFSPDPAVQELVRLVLVWVAILQPVAAVAFVLDGVLIGAGDQRFLAWAMAAAAVVLAVAAAPILPLGLGLGWLWAAFGVFMVARSAVLWRRYRGDAWLVSGPSRTAPPTPDPIAT